VGSLRAGRAQTHHSAAKEDKAVVHLVRQRQIFSADTALCVRQSILFGWESFKGENFDGERERKRYSLSGMESLMVLYGAR
jgi:hypothetical protein